MNRPAVSSDHSWVPDTACVLALDMPPGPDMADDCMLPDTSAGADANDVLEDVAELVVVAAHPVKTPADNAAQRTIAIPKRFMFALSLACWAT